MTSTNPSDPSELTASSAAVPDACSLSPLAFEERIDFVRREIAPHARASHRFEDGIAWDFDARPEMRAKLEEWARLERDCCDGLEFEVWANANAKQLRFEIRGRAADAKILDRMGLATPVTSASSLPAKQREAQGKGALVGWKPLARRGGLAAAIAVAVCCVAPIALVSVAGFAAAAPLLQLDHPITIGAAAVAIMILLWQLEKRSARRRPANASEKDAGCGC